MQKAGADNAGYGFLSVVADDGGYSGGFLVLNANGRPLEFHCTTTVKPSRAQEILYGPTLRPYLVGEQIGATLIKKIRTDLRAIFTDQACCYALRELIDFPLYFVETQADEASGCEPDCASNADEELLSETGPWNPFDHAAGRIYACDGEQKDQRLFENELSPHIKRLSLFEPFDRVREAIGETINPGRAA